MRKVDQLDIFTSSREGRAAAASSTEILDAIRNGTLDRPVMASWGAGVDSTAMIIAMVKMGRPPDLVIFADTGGERPETYAYLEIFDKWLRINAGIGVTICRYVPPNAPYGTLEEECAANGIVPGVALGMKSCSIKWKQTAQHDWLRGVPASGKRPALAGWEPAIDCWARGERVVKLIGFDAGAKDRRRRGKEGDDLYQHAYLLREMGMDRVDCAREILDAGLPIPLKSSCFYCSANKPAELLWLHDRHPDLFRRALVMETRALPKLKESEGLWRKTRVGDGRSGNWRVWAAAEGLIEEDPEAPDGFRMIAQADPPATYPDDEIIHLLEAARTRMAA